MFVKVMISDMACVTKLLAEPTHLNLRRGGYLREVIGGGPAQPGVLLPDDDERGHGHGLVLLAGDLVRRHRRHRHERAQQLCNE